MSNGENLTVETVGDCCMLDVSIDTVVIRVILKVIAQFTTTYGFMNSSDL
jgi:hypothetical protein